MKVTQRTNAVAGMTSTEVTQMQIIQRNLALWKAGRAERRAAQHEAERRQQFRVQRQRFNRFFNPVLQTSVTL